MKSKEQIEKMIESIKVEIDEIHKQRQNLLNRNGGIIDEQNNDMLQDIATLSNQIKILEWVLS
jgi:peptidoglycan hydrolase CwlO-like protein